MKLAPVHAGDIVAIPGPHEPRLGEVRAKQRGRLTVTPWPSATTRDRAAVVIAATEVLAHYRRRARASTAGVGDLVLVDIRGRRFHARVTARPDRGELELDPLTPNGNYFRARPRDLRARWTSTKPAVSDADARQRDPGEGARDDRAA